MFFKRANKMLITKFNKMIRNKTLWWFFAIAVCISFVGVYSGASKSGGCESTMPDAVGKLYGKDVSARDLDRSMYYAMRMRSYRDQSPEHTKLIRQEGWKRLAALKTAESLGITATVTEMTEQIGRDPNFQDNGSFSPVKYKAIIENQLHVQPETFEDFLRQEIILQKLGSIMDACVWTAPSELKQRLTRVTDLFSIQCATLDEEKNAPAVTVSKDEAKKYFEKNIEKFRVPEKVRVKIVTFAVSDYLGAVQVADSDAKKYYDDHIEKYTPTETNRTVASTNVPVATPFATVKSEIIASLKKEKATQEAKDAAARFVTELIPDRKGKSPTIDEVAAKKNKPVTVSNFFALREDIPGLDVDSDFNRAAFALDATDPEKSFSDPIVGKEAVYVLSAKDRAEAHLPEFNNVDEKAMTAARKDAEHEAFNKKCAEIKTTALKALAAGKSFDAIMKDQGAKVGTNMTFSAYEAASSPFEHFDVILPKIMYMSKGEMSDPLETEEGSIFAYVSDRKSGKIESIELLKPEMISAIDRSLAAATYDDWKSYLLVMAGHTDRQAIPDDVDSSEEKTAPKKK